MRSINWPLRKVYHTALTGISYNSTPVNNFHRKAPDDITDKYYIVFGSITSNDLSGKTIPSTGTNIQVVVHTYETKYNNGAAADDIVNQIYAAIYPNANTRPDMSADTLQLVDTKLIEDREQPYDIQNSREYLDRILIFNHRITQQ